VFIVPLAIEDCESVGWIGQNKRDRSPLPS